MVAPARMVLTHLDVYAYLDTEERDVKVTMCSINYALPLLQEKSLKFELKTFYTNNKRL